MFDPEFVDIQSMMAACRVRTDIFLPLHSRDDGITIRRARAVQSPDTTLHYLKAEHETAIAVRAWGLLPAIFAAAAEGRPVEIPAEHLGDDSEIDIAVAAFDAAFANRTGRRLQLQNPPGPLQGNAHHFWTEAVAELEGNNLFTALEHASRACALDRSDRRYAETLNRVLETIGLGHLAAGAGGAGPSIDPG